MKHSIFRVLPAVAFGLLLAAPLRASTFTVTNTGDSTQLGSLRAAITLANFNAGPDDIDFTVTGTILLGSALPDITESVNIHGPGADVLTVNGNNSVRVFNINTTGSDQTVQISGLAITGGRADVGGGIQVPVGDTVSLSDVIIFDNIATLVGGGLRNGGDLTITNTTISGNRALKGTAGFGQGGGIFNNDGGSLTMVDSTIDGNGAFGADSGSGGGIFTISSLQVDLINSTVSGNTANVDGGGISNNGTGSVSLFNTTVVENTADADGDGNGDGGGFRNAGSGRVFSENSIIAENHRSDDTHASDCSGDLRSGGHNLIGNSTGCTFAVSLPDDLLDLASGIDPSLRDNGGPTRTHALLAGSPAIDGGSPEAPGSSKTACETTSQNGVTRPQGDTCDIGAFELPFVADAGTGTTTGGTTGADAGGGATGGGVTGTTDGTAVDNGGNATNAPKAAGGCSLVIR